MTYVPKELKETSDVSRGKKSPRQILEYAFGITIFCIAAYLVLGLVANVLAQSIPDRWEAKLHAPIGEIDTDDERIEKVEQIFYSLLNKLETRDLPFKVEILKDSMPNAFAVPGGGVFVTSGLLDLAKNDSELAFVLAHEIGHHHHRHVLKRLGRSAFLKILGSLMFGADTFNPGNTAVSLAQLGYSREHELEADLFAHDLVQQKIPNSENAYKILGELGNNDPMLPLSNYLSTHPHPDERLARLNGN